MKGRVMGLAGYKTISILSLMILVALAGVSPVFAPEPITFDPPAACPGVIVNVSGDIPFQADPSTIEFAVSSAPSGLVGEPQCHIASDGGNVECSFLVSCVVSDVYTVTVALTGLTTQGDRVAQGSASAFFDVPSTCQSCAAVGGCVQPVNTFALLSPWLAVVGIIGCIGITVVAAKKRRQ